MLNRWRPLLCNIFFILMIDRAQGFLSLWLKALPVLPTRIDKSAYSLCCL